MVPNSDSDGGGDDGDGGGDGGDANGGGGGDYVYHYLRERHLLWALRCEEVA